MEIIPGILEKDWDVIEKRIKLVLPFAKTIHIDIIDGKFVSNTTFLDPKPFAKYSSSVFFELHMMVEDPISYLDSWAQAGFKRFLGHIEKMPSQTEFVAKAQLLGGAGLAIDGLTNVLDIKVPLEDLDCLLLMGIKAGFSGQKLNIDYLSKIESLSGGMDLPIEVDGGISEETITEVAQKGPVRFVSTSFIFNEDPQTQYEKLQKKVECFRKGGDKNSV